MDLEKLYKKAAKRKNSFVEKRIENTIHDICRNQKNKARKPTTALGGSDAFQIQLAQIKAGSDISTLSSEEIVNLIVQHMLMLLCLKR